MALNSIIGFANRAWVIGDIGAAWDLWLLAVPVVVIGAPLGTYAASFARRDTIIGGLCLLILGDLVSTALLVPFTPELLRLASVTAAAAAAVFCTMLAIRRHRAPPEAPVRHVPG